MNADLSIALDGLLTGDLPADAPDLSASELASDLVEADIAAVGLERAERIDVPPQPVRLVSSTRSAGGVIRNVGYGGLFIEMADTGHFPVGESVVLTGFGPLPAAMTVAHHRRRDEGALLGTGSGLGLSFVDGPFTREGLATAVLLGDEFICDGGILRSVLESGLQPFIANNLATAILVVRTFGASFVLVSDANSDELLERLDSVLEAALQPVTMIHVGSNVSLDALKARLTRSR